MLDLRRGAKRGKLIIELLQPILESSRVILGVIFLVAFTSWFSGAIVLAGVDIVRANPMRWLGFDIWKSGFLITSLFIILGLYWR